MSSSSHVVIPARVAAHRLDRASHVSGLLQSRVIRRGFDRRDSLLWIM